MNHDELLKEFGENQGIRDLHLDIQRCCQLKVGNESLILINEIDEENLLINGIIGHMTSEAVERSALTLLSMNMLFAHIDGPYITWDPKQQILLISAPLSTQESNALIVQEQIGYVLQNVAHVKSSLLEKDIEISFVEF
jgi:hypothetical protein